MSEKRIESIEALQALLRGFAAERDWDQFHTPKNLAMALGAEAGELLEVFQWLPESEAEKPSPDVKKAAEREMADVFIYLARLADRLEVDLLEAAEAKMEENARRYPADEVRGSSKKRD